MASIPDPNRLGGHPAGSGAGGAYDVGAPIRQGWGGTIRDARYRPTDRRVTVQDVRADLAWTPGVIDRLAQIGRDVAGLRDPHLLAVYDLIESGGVFRLVAEWSDAPTLAATLRRRSLSAEGALAVVDGVLAGLATLHGAGVFHGHVSPETVVIDAEGRSRIAEVAVCAAAAPPGSGPRADVCDAARLGLHLLGSAGPQASAVRGPLEAAASVTGTVDATRLREELAATADAVLGAGWRDRRKVAPSDPVKRGRRRWWLLLVVLAAVAVAGGAVAAVLVLGGQARVTIPTSRALVIGSDASLAVTPASGGCNTTFVFVARGSLSGTGTLVYRWEQSDGQMTADTSLPIRSNQGAFQLTEAWRLQGSQMVDGSMTLHILGPVERRLRQSFHYACS